MPSSPPLPPYVIMELIEDESPIPCAIRPDWEQAQALCKDLATKYGKSAAGKVSTTVCGVRFDCASVEYYAVEVDDVVH